MVSVLQIEQMKRHSLLVLENKAGSLTRVLEQGGDAQGLKQLLQLHFILEKLL